MAKEKTNQIIHQMDKLAQSQKSQAEILKLQRENNVLAQEIGELNTQYQKASSSEEKQSLKQKVSFMRSKFERNLKKQEKLEKNTRISEQTNEKLINKQLQSFLTSQYQTLDNLFELSNGQHQDYRRFLLVQKEIIEASVRNDYQKMSEKFKEAKELSKNSDVTNNRNLTDSKDKTSSKDIWYNLSEYVPTMLTFQGSTDMLKSAELIQRADETNKAKKSVQLEVISRQVDDVGKALANLDGNDDIETNITLDLDAKRNPHKLAKQQSKEGDDSSVEYAGERFVGYGGVEIAHAYHLASGLGIDGATIQSNITKAIALNQDSFSKYLTYRFTGGRNKNSNESEALVNKVTNLTATTSLQTGTPEDLKLMQIFLVDYTRQLGITPFDVMRGAVTKAIIIEKPIGAPNTSMTTGISSDVLSDNSNTISAATKETQPATQEQIQNLSPTQRKRLDFHLTGLYAYIQNNKMTMPDLRPTATNPGGEPRDNGLSYFGEIPVSNESVGVLSLGTAVKLLDRVFDNESAFHLDLNLIPSLALNKDGIQGYNLFVGPNGQYQWKAGTNTIMNASVFAGTGVLNPKAATAGASIGIKQNFNNKTLGKTTKSLEVSVGGGVNLVAGPYLTGYVGVSIDHIASINDNAQKLNAQLSPLLTQLADTDLASIQSFESFLKNNKKALRDVDVKVAPKFRDDMYGLITTMVSLAGNLDTLKANSQAIFAQLAAEIYTHNEALDLQGRKIAGGGVDLIQMLTSPTIFGKLTALFGIIKIRNYRTLVSQSGQHALSASEYIENDQRGISYRAAKVADKYNLYIQGVIGLATYKIKYADNGDIIIPPNASVFVNGAKVEEEIRIGSDEDISMVVYMDRVEITTNKLKATTEVTDTGPISTVVDKTTSIDTTIPSNKLETQENVSDVICRKIENNFADMKTKLTQNITSVKDIAALNLPKSLSHIKPYYKDLNITADTKPLSQSDFTTWLATPQSYKENYDKYLGGLNAWLLAHYDTADQAKALNVYSQLIRYETVLSGSFLEKSKSKNILRVTQRAKNLDTRLKNEPSADQLKITRRGLTNVISQLPYQGFATISKEDAIGFTRGYKSNSYERKPLTSNNFIANPTATGKNFRDIFVNVPLTDPKIVAYAQEGIGEANIKTLKTNFIEKYKTTIENTQLMVDGKNIALKDLKNQGYSYNLASIAYDSLTPQKLTTVEIKDNTGKVVGSITVTDESGYYMVGNRQCAANETFVYVPDLTGSVNINGLPVTPITPPKPLGNARVQVAQEVDNIATTMRGGVLGGGYARQYGSFGPSTTPGIGEPYNPSTTPNIGPDGKPITTTGGSVSTPTDGGFNPNNPTPTTPVETPGSGSDGLVSNGDTPYRPNSDVAGTILVNQPPHDVGYHQYTAKGTGTNPLESAPPARVMITPAPTETPSPTEVPRISDALDSISEAQNTPSILKENLNRTPINKVKNDLLITYGSESALRKLYGSLGLVAPQDDIIYLSVAGSPTDFAYKITIVNNELRFQLQNARDDENLTGNFANNKLLTQDEFEEIVNKTMSRYEQDQANKAAAAPTGNIDKIQKIEKIETKETTISPSIAQIDGPGLTNPQSKTTTTSPTTTPRKEAEVIAKPDTTSIIAPTQPTPAPDKPKETNGTTEIITPPAPSPEELLIKKVEVKSADLKTLDFGGNSYPYVINENKTLSFYFETSGWFSSSTYIATINQQGEIVKLMKKSTEGKLDDVTNSSSDQLNVATDLKNEFVKILNMPKN